MSSLGALLRLALRRRSMRFAAVVFALLCGLAAFPLFRQPGYELATALGLALAFLGGLPAWAVVGAARGGGAPRPFAPLAGAALVLGVALPLPATLVALA